MNDPLWDLGDLSVEAEFDPDQDEELLAAYFGGPPPAAARGRMVAYKAMCDLLWTLWGLIQHANGNPADDFWAYSANRFPRCNRLDAQRRFRAAPRRGATRRRQEGPIGSSTPRQWQHPAIRESPLPTGGVGHAPPALNRVVGPKAAGEHARAVGKGGRSLMSHSGKVHPARPGPRRAPPAASPIPPASASAAAAARRSPTELRHADPARGRSAAERRQLTVLFCDLVGSTSLASRLDLEELRDVIRSFQAACAAVIRQFGGTISRYMGDGILVLFGYPHAHEDDAERAVRAGLSMVEAVARLRPPAAAGEPLAARVGIATGLVVVGDLIGEGAAEEEAVLGETPNLAARLHALGTAQHRGHRVEHAAPCSASASSAKISGAHKIKGFAAPVPLWRVIAPRSVGSRFQAAGRRGSRRSSTGRTTSAWLLSCWQSARAAPRARGAARGRGRNRQVARRGGAARAARRRAACRCASSARRTTSTGRCIR